jgi:hypothetical protein
MLSATGSYQPTLEGVKPLPTPSPTNPTTILVISAVDHLFRNVDETS